MAHIYWEMCAKRFDGGSVVMAIAVHPSKADVDRVRALTDCKLTCAQIDELMSKPSGWARMVLTWWWQLPEEEGGPKTSDIPSVDGF
jgi:hypothetical protein